jgi:hypothetical protein
MNKNNKQERLVQSVEYNGVMSDYQIAGNNLNGKKVGLVVHNSLNNYQNFLYNRAMFGLSVYTKDEIHKMPWEKRKSIVNMQKKAKRTLNIWKQQMVNTTITKFFEKVFPKTEFTAYFTKTMHEIDPEFNCTIDIKMLGITKKDIVTKLIKEGILPSDFYTLKQETLCK